MKINFLEANIGKVPVNTDYHLKVMKKQLEADLISIAHRVLQLKNKSDINQLYLETQKLYEKLAILRFIDQHFSETKPTIGLTAVEKEVESIFDKNQLIPEQETAETSAQEKMETANTLKPADVEQSNENVNENIVSNETLTKDTADLKIESKNVKENTEIVLEKTEDVTVEDHIETAQDQEEAVTAPIIPACELLEMEDVEKELAVPAKNEAIQISFEDLLGGNYHDTLFVKKQQVENIPTAIVIDAPKAEEKTKKQIEDFVKTDLAEESDVKKVSRNDKLVKGLNIDLNDRLAFIKHLFGNNSEDYNRVINQLITYNSFYETRDFIQEMVKPDYNNWEGKQEYEDRLMNIIEKKFL